VKRKEADYVVPTEEQSGQINIVAPTILGFGNPIKTISDASPHDVSKQKAARDNSIIERNKAKLAALAEQKQKEKQQKQAEEAKK